MWMEELPNGKYKFFERYKDPYTEKWKRVSVTLSSGTSRAKKEAQKLLDDKIDLPHLLIPPPLMAIMLLSNLYIATIVKKQM